MTINVDKFLTNAEHAGEDHTGLPGVGDLTTAAHASTNHAGIPGVGDLTTAAHASLDHTGIPGVPPAETFTAGVHSGTNHAGLPGVGDLTTAAHAALDHSAIPGVGPMVLGYVGVNHAALSGFLNPWGGSTGGVASGTYEPKGVMVPVNHVFTKVAVHHDNGGSITVGIYKRGTGGVANAVIPASPGGVVNLSGNGTFSAGDVLMAGVDAATGNTNLTVVVM